MNYNKLKIGKLYKFGNKEGNIFISIAIRSGKNEIPIASLPYKEIFMFLGLHNSTGGTGIGIKILFKNKIGFIDIYSVDEFIEQKL